MIGILAMSSELALTILPIFLVLYALLVVYCLADAIRAPFRDTSNKRVWILVILLVPLLGSILYLLIGRRQKAP